MGITLRGSDARDAIQITAEDGADAIGDVPLITGNKHTAGGAMLGFLSGADAITALAESEDNTLRCIVDANNSGSFHSWKIQKDDTAGGSPTDIIEWRQVDGDAYVELYVFGTSIARFNSGGGPVELNGSLTENAY
jgi:hypothetical protein